MKKKPELTDAEIEAAVLHARQLLSLLKATTDGEKTTDNRKFNKSMISLRTEIQNWGFWDNDF